jgi:hypothetical protein
MMRWDEYLKWFTERYDDLKKDLLEPGSSECNGGPILTPKPGLPPSAPWKADWAVVFRDKKYFRVKESFNRVGYPYVGAGRRVHFSFHYGQAHPSFDADGYPETRATDTPVADLRIDLDGRLVPHIHVNSPEHIDQTRVDGYSIIDANMFSFLEAVAEHRRTKEPLTSLLKITIRP